MSRSRGVRVTLIILGLYWALFGGLLLFFPATAESMFGIELQNRVLAGMAGFSGLIIALMAFLVSTDPVKYALLVWSFVALLAGEILLNGYNLLTGREGLQQAVPPIVITAILLVALLVFQLQKTSKQA